MINSYTKTDSKGMYIKRMFLLCAGLLLISQTAAAQQKTASVRDNSIQRHFQLAKQPQHTVTGTVTDAQTGNTLPGVNILVKGTASGTATDNKGHYSLNVPSLQDTLKFSYIGYQTQTMSIKGRTTINVKLEPTVVASGNQLVVVGYGTQQKKNLTGAIQEIGSEDLVNRPSAHVLQSLQGQIPGLNIQTNVGNPSHQPEFNIRGFNSVNGGGPLVLIDGVEGDLNRLNPSDIKSVTVLKDAASSAIYGAKGAFGVILVKTKKGSGGNMKINYTNDFGWTTPTSRRDYITNPYLYGKIIDAALHGYNGNIYTGYNDEDWQIIRDVAEGKRKPFYEKQADGTYKFYNKTDWYHYLFRKWQPSQSHTITISGGSDKIQTYLSGRFLRRTKIQNIVNPKYTKYNINAKTTVDLTDWLQVRGNLRYYTDGDMEYGGYRNGYGGPFTNTTWYREFAFLPNGSIDGIPIDRYGDGAQAALVQAANGEGANFNNIKHRNLTGTIRAKITPVKDLVFNFNYTYKYNHRSRSLRENKFPYLTGPSLEKQIVGKNFLSEWRWLSYRRILNAFGTYSKSLMGKHNFKLMLGLNQERFNRDRVLASKGDLLFKRLANLNLATTPREIDGSALNYATRGYFGRFNYNFKNKYLLEVDARYDGSSRFPSENRWGFFPSVSAGWRISKEKFWKPIKDIVSSLKIRTSYGALGNQKIPAYTFTELMRLGRTSWLYEGKPTVYARVPALLPSVVSWETTKVLDFGVNAGFLQDHLTAVFDWYEKNTDGMYVAGQPQPSVLGANAPKENIASLRDRGFEARVSYQNAINVLDSPLSIQVSANVSNFHGVITKYPNPKGLMSTYWKGEKLGTIWGYHVDGQFQSNAEAEAYQKSFGNPSKLSHVYDYVINTVSNKKWKGLRAGDPKYVDIDGDGRIDEGKNTLKDHGDLQPIGNAMPQFPFGFSLNTKWKGFDLSVTGFGVVHQDWYPTGDIYWGMYERPYLSFIRKDLVRNAWTPLHHGKYPQIYRGYAALDNHNRELGVVNDYYLTNIGYLRIKNLTFGYTLPDRIVQKVDIQKLRIYLSFENIYTWRIGGLTKYLDPEIAGSGIGYNNPTNATGRTNAQKYPMGKTYSIGVSITF